MTPHGKRLALLLLVMAGVYLAGNGRTQLFDRDEPRYAQCSRQMLQSGDWVVPRLYDNIRAAKPPGIYWCQATAMKIFGDNAFAARFPSAIAALLTALLLALWVWREAGPRHAVWSAFVLGSSLLMLWSGKSSLTDAVLLLCITIGLGCIYFLWRGRGGWPAVVGLSIAIAAGGLVKGPFILGVLGISVAVLGLMPWLDRWLRRRNRDDEIATAGVEGAPSEMPGSEQALTLDYRSVPPASPQAPISIVGPLLQVAVGLLIIAALVLPWIWLVRHRAPEFLGAARADAMHHLETGAEGHGGWPLYHLTLIWITFLPWSILLPLAMVLAFKNRADPKTRFALAAVVGTWIFVEILQTKLPHYILPAFPALSFLTADAIIRCLDGQQRDLESMTMRIASRFVAGAALVLATVPWWFLAFKFRDFAWAALIPMSVFGIVYAVSVCYFFDTGRARATMISMGVGSMGLAVLLFAVYLPQSQPLRLPIRVADVLIAHGVTHPHEAVMFEYKEPSLAFYQGGTIREYNASLATLAASPDEPQWAVIPKWVWDQATPATRSAFEVVGPTLKGLDYSDAMKVADVMVVRRK